MLTLIIRYKKHAQKQIIERGVDKDLVARAIKRGSKVKQTDGILAIYTYIEVAYVKRGDIYWVKTVKIRD